MEYQLSWITKTECKPIMEVSLVHSVIHLLDGQNHLFSDSKISGFKILEREELISGGKGIVSISNFSFLVEKQKHWLQEALILIAFEIKSQAATEVSFFSSMTVVPQQNLA